MIYYVQLQHMLERMNLLTTKSIESHPDVEMQLRSFRAEVEEYKNQLPIPPTGDGEYIPRIPHLYPRLALTKHQRLYSPYRHAVPNTRASALPNKPSR
jgi:hypothetical protein